jgi:hypothetical protein
MDTLAMVKGKRFADRVRSPLFMLLFCLMTGVIAVSESVASEPEVKDASERAEPHSFQSCVVSGGSVQRDGTARCTTASGQVFTEPKRAERTACTDRCGDGVCQEIVCMAIGCPCAESVSTCPSDCKGQ